MTSLSKIAGVVVAASGVTYGVLAYVDYSKHDTVVRQYESRIKSWESDLNSMQQDVNGKTEKLMAITKDAESDQQVCHPTDSGTVRQAQCNALPGPWE